MTYKAYTDNIEKQTGKSPEYYVAQAKKKGLTKYNELLKWLKSDCGLGTQPRKCNDFIYTKSRTCKKEAKGGWSLCTELAFA